jgi:hypothetical protein
MHSPREFLLDTIVYQSITSVPWLLGSLASRCLHTHALEYIILPLNVTIGHARSNLNGVVAQVHFPPS